MPRGYLKHNKEIDHKSARGGSSRRKAKGTTRDRHHEHGLQSGRKSLQFHNHLVEGDCFANDIADDILKTAALLAEEPENHPIVVEPENRPIAECPICFETGPVISLSKQCRWHESACYQCLRRVYVVEAQKNLKAFPLYCYHPQCSQPVHLAQLEKHDLIHSKEEILKHHELLMLAKARKIEAPHTVYCPHCDFPRVFGNTIKKDRTDTCKNCHNRFLVSPDFATIRALERIQEDKLGGNDGWARCPTCGILISKGDGCSHMECLSCGRDFNWSTIVSKRPLLARPRDNEIYLWW